MFSKVKIRYLLSILIICSFIILAILLLDNDSLTFSKEGNLTIEEALSSKNATNCDFLKNESLKSHCLLILDECEQGDDQCFYGKALHKRFPQGCYLIEDKELSSKCYIQTRDKEILYRAQDNKDTSICEEHQSQSKQISCRDQVFYYLAELENKVDYCNNIKSEVLRNECLS